MAGQLKYKNRLLASAWTETMRTDVDLPLVSGFAMLFRQIESREMREEIIEQLGFAQESLQRRDNYRSHVLYTNNDADAPNVIRDKYGDVTLDMCKYCGHGEMGLEENRCPKK